MNAIVLAGGESSRFGSNKALIEINGERLITRIVSNLQEVFTQVYVVGNKETDYSFLNGVIIVEDIFPGKGPLGGLYTGLVNSFSKYNFLVGCDMPFLKKKYLRLLKNWERDYDVLVSKYNGYIEPLGGVYSKNTLPVIEKYILQGELKIKGFFPEVKVEVITEDILREIGEPDRMFYNINYKNDLEEALKYINNNIGGEK